MMKLMEDVIIRCGRCGKVSGIHKQMLILSPMYMIMAIIEWVKKSNFITRAT